MSHEETEIDEDAACEFTQARFAIDLNLPSADGMSLEDAKRAIRKEYRDSAKWKRLRCRKVSVVSETESGTVYELEIGHAVEFNWTWEGSVAFRPLLLKEFEDSQATFFENGSIDPDIDDSIVWSGEVLEVDEASGRIFIVVSNPEHPPRRGSFYVRPFEFLAFLDAVYNEPAFTEIRSMLPPRLAAAKGNIHPDVKEPANVGLDHLQEWWQKSWSVLWGPPGTGKTYTTGQQVARVLSDPSERILVVSTTNRATDAVAVSIGRAAVGKNVGLEDGQLLRIGKGASLKRFENEQLTDMLRGTETEFLAQIETLAVQLARSENPKQNAMIRKEIKEIREAMNDAAQRNFLDGSVRVVVSTSFKATTFLNYDEIKEDLAEELCPFTTIFIDEAGLMSRVAIAALSLLASRRVVLVGDSKQLAPISRISRILEPAQGNWLARSGLSHLDRIGSRIDGVHVLSEQRRMHSDVCDVVSAYQYDDFLTTADDIKNRPFKIPNVLAEQPRAVWYVLDEDTDDTPSIRAERGAGNRSWIRKATLKILAKLFSDPTLRSADGLFISPFKAQAKVVHSFFAANNLESWMASTVHSQQGSEADVVIFDSVNAGSYGWPYDEWKRLVNVALSRSREAIIVLSSRAEMEEPYLRPLLKHLSPRIVQRNNNRLAWTEVPLKTDYKLPAIHEEKAEYQANKSSSIGTQLAKRKDLRPVLSHEQERLCGLELDGKPRLVRGVAGSGKTVILAHWLMQTVQRLDDPNARIWAVFANRSLQSLIGESIVSAWEKETDGKPFPWDRVELHHVKEILEVMLPEVGLSAKSYGFEYDDAAEAYLEQRAADQISARCDALFIDEAQDMGPNTLKLLSSIVRQSDESDENSRSVNIFYDNAQNIYGRSTPKWSELGLDMRGRSTVMKESFRSTKPITEFALNVLYRLQPPETNPDHKELVARGLIEQTKREGTDWWNVRFNQVDGPNPQFRQFMNLDQEFDGIADYCRELIAEQGVQPSDICLIYNGGNIKYRLEKQVAPALADLGVELSVQANKPFERSHNILLATTSHSYKGYDSEVVIVPAADQYTAKEKGILANNLYVAMTRARSILTLFSQKMRNSDAELLYEVIEDCLGNLEERPEIECDNSPQDDLIEILDRIGRDHRKWLVGLWNTYGISQEPLTTKTGEIIAEPLFFVRANQKHYACFGSELPRQRVRQRLEDYGVQLLEPGQEITVPKDSGS
ncbi:AAA domain-containing protein [Rubripirellula reticaptiva]|uniref:ATP-dependent RecD-like DNA helicase n=1 Tax=Rubripirellula reticaptiva TaxID=2528013 RepID=A0A5C6EKI2_9BACT|nr:AAA domain-containing protein [Rubripirellula reticaptiva]TWU49318.1 ATP-dependent RecD-like DNA helicase [Rubripirellula reticaptiva]